MIRDTPARWHLPIDVDEQYFEQMTKEQRVLEVNRRTGRTCYIWKKPFSSAANHLFDCEVYALGGAYLLDLEHVLTNTTKAEVKDVEKANASPPRREKTNAESRFDRRFAHIKSRKFFSRG